MADILTSRKESDSTGQSNSDNALYRYKFTLCIEVVKNCEYWKYERIVNFY